MFDPAVILMWAGIFLATFLVIRTLYRFIGDLADADFITIREDEYFERYARPPKKGRIAWLVREVKRVWLRRQRRDNAIIISDFNKQHPFAVPGAFAKLRERTIYPIARPGSIVCISKIILDARESSDANPQVIAYLTDEFGLARSDETVRIAVNDLEKLTPEEKEAIREEYEKPIIDPKLFEDGDPVWVLPDIQVHTGFDQFGKFSALIRIHEPMKGFVDMPDSSLGANLHDLNHIDVLPAEFCVEGRWWIYDPLSYTREVSSQEEFCLRRKFRGPKRSVFLPSLKRYRAFDPAELQHRSYDREMFSRVVLDDEARTSLLSVAPPRDPEQLREWGLGENFLQHQSNCILFYGPHGTGKTLTAEALAEYLGVPFYPIDMGDIGRDIEKGFHEIAKRAKRWKAVVLWNEAESFLEDRSHTGYEARGIAALVLQQLEFFDGGMLIIATNHPGRIDPGFNSRFPVKIGFQLTPDKRREIWKAHLPEKMPVKQDELETMLPRVANIPIDGRQIQQAVHLAATRASNERLAEIPSSYLLAAAQQIQKDSEALERTKPDGDQRGKIGFSHE